MQLLLLAATVAITNIQTDWSDVIACTTAKGTTFTAECYAHALMIRMNALQLDLLQLVPTDWTDYRTEYYIIVANYSAVRYFVQLLVKHANDQVLFISSYSANNCSRCGCDSQTSKICYNEQSVTIMTQFT